MQTKEMKHITYWGLGLNVILTATKGVLGYAMHSSSVIAEVGFFPRNERTRQSTLSPI